MTWTLRDTTSAADVIKSIQLNGTLRKVFGPFYFPMKFKHLAMSVKTFA